MSSGGRFLQHHGIRLNERLWERIRKPGSEVRKQYLALGIVPGQNHITRVPGVGSPGMGPNGKMWFGMMIGHHEYVVELLSSDKGQIAMLAHDPTNGHLYFREVAEGDKVSAGGSPSKWRFGRIKAAPGGRGPSEASRADAKAVAGNIAITLIQQGLRWAHEEFILPTGETPEVLGAYFAATMVENFAQSIGWGPVGTAIARVARAYEWVILDPLSAATAGIAMPKRPF